MYRVYKSILNENARIARDILSKQWDKDEVDMAINLFKDIDSTNKYLGLLAKIYSQLGDIPSEISMGIKKLNDQNIKLKNVNEIKNADDLLASINDSLRSKTKIKKGKLDIMGGKDYLKIPLPDDDIQAYIPLNPETMKVLGHKRYGGVTGEWCISQNDNEDTYIHYAKSLDSVICIVIDEFAEKDYAKKWAMTYGMSDDSDHSLTIKVFDANNELSFPEDVPHIERIYDYLENNYDKIRSQMER